MHCALCNALRRPRGTGREEIWSDSLYAINMTTGKWKLRCKRNARLVDTIRTLWRRLQRERPRETHLLHVRSHIKIPGNELADWLADMGRTGGTDTASAREWIYTWLRSHQHTRPPGDPG